MFIVSIFFGRGGTGWRGLGLSVGLGVYRVKLKVDADGTKRVQW